MVSAEGAQFKVCAFGRGDFCGDGGARFGASATLFGDGESRGGRAAGDAGAEVTITLTGDLSASSGGNGLSDDWLAIAGVVAVVGVEIVSVLLVVGVAVSGESTSGVSPASSDCEKRAPLQ